MRIDGLELSGARGRAMQDPYWFAWHVMGFDKLYEPLHGMVCRWVVEFFRGDKKFGLLMLPRGHYKTTLTTISESIRQLLIDPDKRILLAHAKRSMAIDYFGEIKWHMENNEKLRAIAPDVLWHDPKTESPKWLQDKIMVKRKRHDKVATIEIASPEASVVGKHFDIIILDDLVDGDNVKTPYQRDSVKQWIRQALNMLRPGGKILGVGTAWHHDDAWQMLRDERGPFAKYLTSMIMGAYGEPGAVEGEPIFPAQFDDDELTQRREQMGPRVFASQMLNDPTPSAEAIFKRENLSWFDALRPPMHLACNYYTAVDLNRGTLANPGDYGVVMTAARDHNGHVWVVDMTRGHPSQQQMIQWISNHVLKWQPVSVFVETTGGQITMAEALRMHMVKTGITFNMVECKRSRMNRKADRVMSLEALVENRALHLKMGVADELALELEHYGAWKYDDCIDCLADIWMNSHPPRMQQERHRAVLQPNTWAHELKLRRKMNESAKNPRGVARKVWA